ncbi:MAG: phosphatidylserine decarboxylase [Deltaproteobacteria bacterium GWC2_56_8]|nr:MAG: phosphatidylserine decarboxylase [Deltaproteobacteria bacterium GWB2_55_19]OGP35891.1 MAG: phosphatidylserine decarboxylase [Deltaproteobacteria bacterium GWC2_56_8]HAO93474.1 phosphatidylserine decarboxylase family protein [Deltaproteobacteria bacterium]
MRIPIAKEGAPFIAIALFCVIVVWLLGGWRLEFVLVPLAVFVIAFFRDPERAVPADIDSIVSPADGRVIKVERMRDERLLKTEAVKISVFMNVFNVHVNRSPAEGKVLDIIYNPGKFFNASLDKASLLNEQNALIMQAANGKRYAFNQIAGLIARRIVCRVKKGASLKKGERFGLIRFGSRVDVYLPTDCRVSVKVGDKVKAGSSILGYWNAR